VTKTLSCFCRTWCLMAPLALLAFPVAGQIVAAPNPAMPNAAAPNPATPSTATQNDATRNSARPAPLPGCVAAPDAARFAKPLLRLAARLARSEPIAVVAIGSSSTAGAGASAGAFSYPSQLEAELNRRFPRVPIRVLNRGVNGEEAPEMLARLDRDVIAENPDLVLWQIGTNAVLRDRGVDEQLPVIRQGLAHLKAAGFEVVLIDLQYAPKVTAKPDADRMVSLISTVAKLDNVDLFHRFAAMRYWREVRRLPFDLFVSPDGVHMNDWSYACMARLIAADIFEAATRAPMTATRGR
jgi:acyl-CoA thioesterase I